MAAYTIMPSSAAQERFASPGVWGGVNVQARKQRGGCIGCIRTPKWVKCKIKNTVTVHNAPCFEERSTFLQKHPHFPLFFTKKPPIFRFLQKNIPHFPLFYTKYLSFSTFFYKKHPPFHFLPMGLTWETGVCPVHGYKSSVFEESLQKLLIWKEVQ